MRKRNSRDRIIVEIASEMPTIKWINKPVTRSSRVATITITDRSNGENFIVGKSKQWNQWEDGTVGRNLPVNWAKLCISSEKEESSKCLKMKWFTLQMR